MPHTGSTERLNAYPLPSSARAFRPNEDVPPDVMFCFLGSRISYPIINDLRNIRSGPPVGIATAGERHSQTRSSPVAPPQTRTARRGSPARVALRRGAGIRRHPGEQATGVSRRFARRCQPEGWRFCCSPRQRGRPGAPTYGPQSCHFVRFDWVDWGVIWWALCRFHNREEVVYPSPQYGRDSRTDSRFPRAKQKLISCSQLGAPRNWPIGPTCSPVPGELDVAVRIEVRLAASEDTWNPSRF